MLAKKLGLKPGMHVAIAGAPKGLLLTAPDVVVQKSLERELDLVMLFATTQKDLNARWPIKYSPGLEKERHERQQQAIRDTDGTICVDRKARAVTAPKDLQKLLARNAKALATFDSLSFTNRKEYVVWIIGAKKPETRAARLAKTVEKLAQGKKNPNDK